MKQSPMLPDDVWLLMVTTANMLGFTQRDMLAAAVLLFCGLEDEAQVDLVHYYRKDLKPLTSSPTPR
jgi:hypothetical protein